jgi:hypothetical protein
VQLWLLEQNENPDAYTCNWFSYSCCLQSSIVLYAVKKKVKEAWDSTVYLLWNRWQSGVQGRGCFLEYKVEYKVYDVAGSGPHLLFPAGRKTYLHELFLAVADIDAYVEGRGRMWCSGWNNLNASSMVLTWLFSEVPNAHSRHRKCNFFLHRHFKCCEESGISSSDDIKTLMRRLMPGDASLVPIWSE